MRACWLRLVMGQRKQRRQQVDAGGVTFCAVFRVLILYACIVFIHSLLYWGRRALRARTAAAAANYQWSYQMPRCPMARKIYTYPDPRFTRELLYNFAWLTFIYIFLLTLFELIELLRPKPVRLPYCPRRTPPFFGCPKCSAANTIWRKRRNSLNNV